MIFISNFCSIILSFFLFVNINLKIFQKKQSLYLFIDKNSAFGHLANLLLAFADFVNSKADSLAVCFDEETEKIKIRHISYGSRENEISLARDIFSVLRQVDKYGVSAVYVHAPSKTGVGLAVYNRLLRAASFRVIKV